MRPWKQRFFPIGARCLALACALCLVLGMMVNCGLEARAEGYTYTVRFYAGKQGSIHNGDTLNVIRDGALTQIRGVDPDGKGEVLVYEGLMRGDTLIFYQEMAEPSDGSKYYVKGIRESGMDNSTVSLNAFTVTEDQDFVVAYGISGDLVSYQVNYVEAGTGAELAPSRTYYGNAGDKAVVAYLYIEGYQPQAYNIGKTLVKGESNEINFEYTRIQTPAAPAQPGTVQPGGTEGNPPGGEAQPGGEGQQAGEGQPGTGVIDQGGTNFDDAGGAGGEAQPGGQDANPDDVEIDENDTPLGPDEYLDIDDQQVPQAGGIVPGQSDRPLQIGNDAVRINLAANAVVAAISAGCILTGFFLLLKFGRKREKKKDE